MNVIKQPLISFWRVCLLTALFSCCRVESLTVVSFLDFGYPASDYFFLHQGDTLTWSAGVSSDFTVQSYGGEFRSAPLKKGGSFSFTFERTGFFAYKLSKPGSVDVPCSVLVEPRIGPTPSIEMNVPSPGSQFPPLMTFPIQATVTNDSTDVAAVDFFLGTNLVATATNTPYRVGVLFQQSGNFELTARLTDKRGLRTTSPPVPITLAAEPRLIAPRLLPSGELLAFYSVGQMRHLITWYSNVTDRVDCWSNPGTFEAGYGIFIDGSLTNVPIRFYRTFFCPG
jgi:hypothetical protein